MKTVDFSETIAASDLKVGIGVADWLYLMLIKLVAQPLCTKIQYNMFKLSRHLIEYMKVCEY